MAYEDNDFWGGLRDAFKGFFNNESVQGFGREVLPGVAGGFASGALNSMFPGSSGTNAIDTRTAEGKGAEGIRAGAAGGAAREYNMALQGKLDPRAEEQIRRRSRNASAANGGLDTGGAAQRETNSIQDEVNRIKNLGAGNVASLTSGFQGRQLRDFNRPNPWAAALTGPVGRGFEKGFGSAWDKWKAKPTFDWDKPGNEGLNINFNEQG